MELFIIALHKSLYFPHWNIIQSCTHKFRLEICFLLCQCQKILGCWICYPWYQLWMCYFLSLDRISIRPYREYFWRWPTEQLQSPVIVLYDDLIRPYHCFFFSNILCALALKVWIQSSNMQDNENQHLFTAYWVPDTLWGALQNVLFTKTQHLITYFPHFIEEFERLNFNDFLNIH